MSKLKKYVQGAGDIYLKVEMFFLIFLTLLFGALNMVEIVRRMFGMPSLRWMEEFSRYMLVVTTMIGSSIAVSSDGHMIMDTLVLALPKRAAIFFKALTNLICGVFWLFFGRYSYTWVSKLVRVGSKMATVSAPMYIIWIPFCICCFSAAVRSFIQVWKKGQEFIHYKKDQTSEEGTVNPNA